MYWRDNGLIGGRPDFDARSFKTSVVRDMGGTILLVEEPNGQGAVGNEWPSISLGPQGSGSLYQIDPAATQQNPAASGGVNQGNLVYKAHGQRFNYLFHDGHVQSLKTTETIGSGTVDRIEGHVDLGRRGLSQAPPQNGLGSFPTTFKIL
ncbi:MAG: hypothetical protein QM813_15195 [Verrucomicrobiota bacterium]